MPKKLIKKNTFSKLCNQLFSGPLKPTNHKSTNPDTPQVTIYSESTDKSGNPLLDFGPVDAEVHGNMYPYCQSLLREIYRQTTGKDTIFTLTPICQYQIDKGWPEPPFVNINMYGSEATERENWLGYIPINYSDIEYRQLINDNGNIDVHGCVKRDGKDFVIILKASEEYSSLFLRVQHDEGQIEYLTNLARSNPDTYYIQTIVSKDSDGLHYKFSYQDEIIAQVSSRKIKLWLNGDSLVDRAEISISHFREDYDNQHYSRARMDKHIKL